MKKLNKLRIIEFLYFIAASIFLLLYLKTLLKIYAAVFIGFAVVNVVYVIVGVVMSVIKYSKHKNRSALVHDVLTYFLTLIPMAVLFCFFILFGEINNIG